MEDIAPKLLEEIKKVFQQKVENDAFIAKYLEKLRVGKVNFNDTQLYTKKLGEILSHALKEVLKEDVLPGGRLYWNIAERTIKPMLEKNYELVNTAAFATQKIIDLKEGIHLEPLKPKISHERIKSVLDNATVEELDFEEVKKRLSAPIVNLTESFFDDFIKTNADFRYKADFKPQIIRTLKGKNPCRWCKALAGTYDYGEIGKNSDVFRRHQNCHCQVTYKTSKFKQDIWIKKKEMLEVDFDERHLQFYKSTSIDQSKSKYSERANRYVYKSIEYDNIYIANNVRIKRRQLHNINARVNKCIKLLKTDDAYEPPKIFIVNKDDMNSHAIGAYNPIHNCLYLIPKLGDSKTDFKNFQIGVACSEHELSTYLHELIHWKVAQEYIKKYGEITSANYNLYLKRINKRALDILNKKKYNIDKISKYALESYYKFKYDEVVTEQGVVDILKGKI